MGYQDVEAVYLGAPQRAIVYNAELLVWDQGAGSFPRDTYEDLLKAANTTEASRIRTITVVSRPRAVAESTRKAFAGGGNTRPATEGDKNTTKAGEVFARFTAYRNDRRITSERGLLPGTYATTNADANQVKTGSEAVERYALPNPQPANFRFRIDPQPGTIHRQGIVQPAFGRSGGGVEVLFDNGSGAHTVSGPVVLPP